MVKCQLASAEAIIEIPSLVLPQAIPDFFVKTVLHLREQVDKAALPLSSRVTFWLAVEDMKIAQMALRYQLCRKNQLQLNDSGWTGLDKVNWSGLACPAVLKDYFSIRAQGREVAAIALDYDLSEGKNITSIDGESYAWNGADLAMAIRLIEQAEGFSPVLIVPNSVHQENNEKILQAAGLVSGRDEESEGTVSVSFRQSKSKNTFLENT